LRARQTLKTRRVTPYRSPLCGQRDDLAGTRVLSGHADLKDLLGFLASGKTAQSRHAKGGARGILGRTQPMALGPPPNSDAMASEWLGTPRGSRPSVVAVSSAKAREARHA